MRLHQVEEVYSIVKVVNDNIFYCQRTSEPTGQGALMRLFFLLTDTLESKKPLEIVHVAPVGEESGISTSRRPHQQLTETGRETRDAFRAAFAARFLSRYGKHLANGSHLFDRTMFLCPASRRLKYVDSLLASTAAIGVALASASEIKRTIRAEVHKLLTDAVKEKRVRDKKAAESATAIVDTRAAGTPAAKRARTTAGDGSATEGGATVAGGSGSGAAKGVGFWDDSDDDQEHLPPVECDAKEEANSLLNDWMAIKVTQHSTLVRFCCCRRTKSGYVDARRSSVAELISGVGKSDRRVVIVYTKASPCHLSWRALFSALLLSFLTCYVPLVLRLRPDVQFTKEQKEMDGAEYWRLHGKRHPVALQAVAQAVYGVPASAGVMERDFCIADFFLPRKRGSLDPAYLEMCLYLHAQFDSIPADVPKLADDAVENALPERFKNPALLHEVQVMDYVEKPRSDEDDDTEDPAWVAVAPQSDGSGHEGGDSLGSVP